MSSEIQTVFNSISSYEELGEFVKEAKQDISFWGFRYVYVAKYKGRLHIEELVVKVMNMVKANLEFTEEERAIGKEAKEVINRLRQDNVRRKEEKNLFTYFLCSMRDYWNENIKDWGYGPIFYWERESYFDCYTKNQYKKAFNEEPSCDPDVIWHPRTKYPDRWEVPQKGN